MGLITLFFIIFGENKPHYEYPEKSTDYHLWDKAKEICINYVDAIIKEKGYLKKEYKIIKK